MSVLLFSNNFSSTLSVTISSSDTTIVLVSSAGLPTIVGDEYFLLSISNSNGTLNEIVKVTALSGESATVVRGQEGTTAQTWTAGAVIENRWTAGSASSMQQTAQAQAQGANYAVASGTNTIAATFSPALTSHVIGMPLRVKIANTNTGAVTFNPGPSAISVTGPDSSDLIAGDLVAGDVVELIYNGVSYLYQMVQASTTRIGISRLATVAESQTGTSQTLAVTPAGLAAVAGAINSVPVGTMLVWSTTTPPSGYLECNGATISTITYAALYAVIGGTWGGGGSTFNVPDMRGYFPRGWSHGSSIDPGRGFATIQGDAFAAHWHDSYYYGDNSGSSGPGHGGGTQSSIQTSTNGGATETRPINRAVMYCIKY